MPNWCFNKIDIYTSPEDRDKFLKMISYTEDECNSPLNSLIPCPPYFSTQEGFNNGGYEWCVKNWGSKWEEVNLDVIVDNDIISVVFDSAWSPPIVGYQRISEMFPDSYFLHYYCEEGMGFMGATVTKNQLIIFEEDYEGNNFPGSQSEDFDENYDEIQNHRHLLVAWGDEAIRKDKQ